MLAVLVIFGGSLSAFAKPPIRSFVYGVVYQSGGNSAYYALNIYPISNNIFSVKPRADYELCTIVNFYFRADVSGFTSFHLRLRRLSTAYEDLSTSLSSYQIYLRKLNDDNTFSDNVSIRTECITSKDVIDGYTEYDWLYTVSTPVGSQNVVQVSIPFQNFLFFEGSSMYWEMLAFDVNGESTVFTAGEQAIITNLEAINGAINDDVPLPSAVPSLEDIGGEIVNEGIDLAQSWVQYFTTNFDIAGAMTRVVKPFSDYFLVIPNDGNTAHTTLVVIMLFSLGAVFVVWLINKLKRRQDDA